MNCHANGDIAIDHVLTAYERALHLAPQPDARPKITHCTLVNDDLVHRIKAIGAVPALFTSYAYYNPDKFHFYGEELMKRCMAFRTLMDAGVPRRSGIGFRIRVRFHRSWGCKAWSRAPVGMAKYGARISVSAWLRPYR